MSKEELNKYADLLISMATDFRLSGITEQTFRNNLLSIGLILNPSHDLEIKESIWLDAALDLEKQPNLSLKSIKLAWASRFRGKAGKLRDQIEKLKTDKKA